MTEFEFAEILADESKEIASDIRWTNDEDHSPAVEFRQEIQSGDSHPLFVRGSFNQEAQTLTFALIHKTEGRVYALDLGKLHRNPDGKMIGRKHKHSWKEPPIRDRFAYEPSDITAPISDPVEVWRQFCLEARIRHSGKLANPPHLNQRSLF